MPGAVIRNPTPDWLKPENASVLDSPVTKAIRTLAHLIGADDPQSQVLGLMTPLVPDGQAMASKPVQKALKTLADLGEKVGIRAYHGSPHDFDQFSLSKIGTGEGAQMYGHGMYFAESPEVAQSYRKPGMWQHVIDTTIDGTPASQWANGQRTPIEARAADALGRTANIDEAISYLDQDVAYDPMAARAKQWLEQNRSRVSNTGKTYEVQINADPDQLLDWDKPLSQQSGQVQSAARRLIEQAKRDAQANNRYAAQALLESKDYVPADPTGADIHRILSRTMNDGAQFNQTTVSKALREQGIPGIKYLDGGSRAAGEGSRNFVIFDDSLVSILKKYGVALPVIEGLRRKANAQGGTLRAEDVQAVF